ncbi:MAG: hypothetical protein ACRDK9_02610 [Solirubrobacterales bacterium]
MDDFLAACQGAGLALAAGIFAGASGRRGGLGTALLVIAILGGAALYALSLDTEVDVRWAGALPGALLAYFAFVVARDVSEGAREREGGGAGEALIALAGLVLAGLSLVLPPVSLVALAALAWLAIARRRRAARKYEGLRTLR